MISALDLEAFGDWVQTHPDQAAQIAVSLRQLAIVDPAMTALADQTVAAAMDYQQRFAALTERIGEPHLPALDRAITLGALDAFAHWLNDETRTCTHSPTWRTPQMVIAAAWKPGLVICGYCTHLLRLPRDSPIDRTCDRCGHVCTATGEDMIFPGHVQMLTMVYLFGLCPGCEGDAVAAAREAHQEGTR